MKVIKFKEPPVPTNDQTVLVPDLFSGSRTSGHNKKLCDSGWDTDKERESEDALHMAKPEPAHHYVTRGLYSFFL